MRRSLFLATLLLPIPFAVLPLVAVFSAGDPGSSSSELTFADTTIVAPLDEAVSWPSADQASSLTASDPCENPIDLT